MITFLFDVFMRYLRWDFASKHGIQQPGFHTLFWHRMAPGHQPRDDALGAFVEMGQEDRCGDAVQGQTGDARGGAPQVRNA